MDERNQELLSTLRSTMMGSEFYDALAHHPFYDWSNQDPLVRAFIFPVIFSRDFYPGLTMEDNFLIAYGNYMSGLIYGDFERVSISLNRMLLTHDSNQEKTSAQISHAALVRAAAKEYMEVVTQKSMDKNINLTL